MATDLQTAPVTDARPHPAANCLGCGYELHGLTAHERCPECGVLVATTIARQTLAGSDPRWLRSMSLATWLLMVGFAATWASFADSRWGVNARFYVELCGNIAVVLAIWALTTPEPHALDRQNPQRLRWFTRIVAILAALAPVIGLFGDRLPTNVGGLLFYMTASLQVATPCLALAYFRALLLRMPSPRLARHVAVITWLVVPSMILVVEIHTITVLRLWNWGMIPGSWMPRLGMMSEYLVLAGWAGLLVATPWMLYLLWRFRRACHVAAQSTSRRAAAI